MTPPQPDPALSAVQSPDDDSALDDDAAAHPVSQPLDRALDLVRFLRANCEWDAAQTPESLIRYLLEEAGETADAIRAADASQLAAELGDLLLNVAFQVVIAEERDQFTADDVVRGLEQKMRRRHPHLYGDGPRRSWTESKTREQEGSAAADLTGTASSIIDQVAEQLPPLVRAHAVQARVAEVGFDWPDATGAMEKVREEVGEVSELIGTTDASARDRIEDEIGDLLFAVVNLARLTGIDSSTALRRANAKFCGRFRDLEREAAERGVVLGEASLEELDAIWNDVKQR